MDETQKFLDIEMMFPQEVGQPTNRQIKSGLQRFVVAPDSPGFSVPFPIALVRPFGLVVGLDDVFMPNN